jgi:hypothetical protein
MNIVDILNAKRATPETILQIMDTTVFEASGELSPDEMLTRMKSTAGNDMVDDALRRLQANPEAITEIALLWISDLAETENKHPLLEGAITSADTQMPLLEVGALTLVALYAIYTWGPDKATKQRRRLKQKDDGTREWEEDTDYADFSEPLRGFLGFFGHKDIAGKADHDDPADRLSAAG